MKVADLSYCLAGDTDRPVPAGPADIRQDPTGVGVSLEPPVPPVAALAAVGHSWMHQVLDALPAAIYTTDAEGHVTFFNRAAVELSGRQPVLGSDRWCVTWRLYRTDGTLLPHDECPMAVALREQSAIAGAEIIAERPDGSRVPVLAYPTPLRD